MNRNNLFEWSESEGQLFTTLITQMGGLYTDNPQGEYKTNEIDSFINEAGGVAYTNLTSPNGYSKSGNIVFGKGFVEDNPSPEPVDDKNWFYVEDVSGEGNTLIIRLDFEDDPSEITASYDFYVSKDKESWTKLDTLNSTSKTVMYEFGECEKVYLRCSASFFYDDDFEYGVRINCINSYNVGGNSMSLLYGTDFTGNEEVLPECSNNESTFSCLFYESETLISAEKLILPATTLANSCYSAMFQGCTSLTTAPILPAMTLAQYCYGQMFYGCTSLTTAPALPATTLSDSCYGRMFFGCTSLNEVTIYANDISAEESLDAWLYHVAQTGTFYNLGGATYETGESGIPEGWIIK